MTSAELEILQLQLQFTWLTKRHAWGRHQLVPGTSSCCITCRARRPAWRGADRLGEDNCVLPVMQPFHGVKSIICFL